MGNSKVDFNFFIQSTIQKNIPWENLASLLIHLAPTPEKSNKVIEMLVQELELWVSKVEIIQIKHAEVPNENLNNFDNDDNSEKANSEDESFLSDPESTNDPEIIHQELEENKQSFDDAQNYFDESMKTLAHETYLVEFVKDKDEEGRVYDRNLENDQENFQSFENKIDHMASRLYEFIGSNDEDSQKEQNELANTADLVVSATKLEEEASQVKMENQTLNSEEKRNQCNICGKCFKNRFNKIRHEMIHTGERPYECEFCPKAFNDKGHLRTHKRIHSGENPYQCETCTKCFKTISNLKRHCITHTDEKPFECKTCQKCFSQSSNLKTHERLHTGEKPFQCKTCRKSFSDSSALKRHERIHTNPFQCKTCKRSFARTHSRKIHERIHTVEKPIK